MLIENTDVDNLIANGSLCIFKGLKLKNGYQDLFKISIDGYYVNCVKAEHVKYIVLELKCNTPRTIHLESKCYKARAKIPAPIMESNITHKTGRIFATIKLVQFPINIANAITVHKLQGQSINNLVTFTWNYTGNWIYVLLLRVKTMKGLFLQNKLLHSKTRGMSKECKKFYDYFEKHKFPKYFHQIIDFITISIHIQSTRMKYHF